MGALVWNLGAPGDPECAPGYTWSWSVDPPSCVKVPLVCRDGFHVEGNFCVKDAPAAAASVSPAKTPFPIGLVGTLVLAGVMVAILVK